MTQVRVTDPKEPRIGVIGHWRGAHAREAMRIVAEEWKMSHGLGRMIAAVGLSGAALIFGSGELTAGSIAAHDMIDVSAQQKVQGKHKAVPRGPAPRAVAPRVAPQRAAKPVPGSPRVVAPKATGPAAVGPAVVRPPAVARPGVARVAPRTTVYRGRSVTYVRGPWTVRRGPYIRSFVAASVLAPLVIGAVSYYPYGYLPFEGPSCSGITPDGCELRWIQVPTVDGFRDFQCVAFCPWQ
jgi:hypothetical protein